MPHSPTLTVHPIRADLRDAVLALQVQPDQQVHVGRIIDLLADAESRPSCEPMAVLLDDHTIGFYCIETVVRTVTGHDLDLPALGLRGFFIDARWQRRGWGAAALEALLRDLASRHPKARLLALTVSADNAAAMALYQRGGFGDSGERYHGGRAGPQHLLLRALGA